MTTVKQTKARRPTLIPSILITPPPEDGATSNLVMLTPSHWALWARGRNATRKLDRTNASGQDYGELSNEIEIDALLPPRDETIVEIRPDMVRSTTNKEECIPKEVANSPKSTTPDGEDGLQVRQHLTASKCDQGESLPPVKPADRSPTVADEDRQVFDQKNMAVLDYIKFRGRMMQAFEEKYGESWYKIDGPILLPSRSSLQGKAEALLEEFAANPIPDAKDMLEAEIRGRKTVWRAWHATLRAKEDLCWIPECVPSAALRENLQGGPVSEGEQTEIMEETDMLCE